MFDSEQACTPAGLDQLAPGSTLADFLASVDIESLSGHDRVVVLRVHQKMVSYYQAQVYRDMAAVSDALDGRGDDPALQHEAAAAEIRVALRLTRRAADTELSHALDLKERLPQVFEALQSGDIDPRRARTILYGTTHLPAETARAVVEQVIEAASRLTTGQLAARIRRLCIEADPDDAQQRYEEALTDRRVTSEATEAGTANLLALDLPPDRLAAATSRINRIARGLRRGDDPRTIDQIRADVLLDLLSGAAHQSSTGGVVDIQVDASTLAELSEVPGELAGYGPVIADIARQVADQQVEAEWRYTVTDPATGQPIHHGTTRRRPAAAHRREVQARDRTCVFPGCRMPATACDLDHRVPYAGGGPTQPSNLVPLCRHDHRIRHEHHWTHQPQPNGDHHWTTQLGHTYTTSGKPP